MLCRSAIDQMLKYGLCAIKGTAGGHCCAVAVQIERKITAKDTIGDRDGFIRGVWINLSHLSRFSLHLMFP
jgi:hypothetical protein